MQEKPSRPPIVTVAFLITGNLVGAGILALPIKTGLSGFLPSLFAMAIAGTAMFFTAVVLAGEATRTKQPTFNYPSLYRKHLGIVGKWIAVAANLIILYGLLTAYLTGATTIIKSLLHATVPNAWILVPLFLIVTGVNITGMDVVRRYNAMLMILLWASFAILVLMSERHVDVERLTYVDWRFLPSAVPIIVTAFHFHNIIPSVCHSLEWDSSAIWKTMLWGMIIGYVMNALWVQVGLGALPLQGSEISIATGLARDLPATVLLSNVVRSPVFMTCSMLFALLAIVTSYLANGTGLMAFMEDLIVNTVGRSNRWLNVGISFGPPLLIALLYPDIFLKALDVVGGVGIVVLFGILPSAIAVIRWRSPAKRALGVVMLLLFLVFLIFELGQELGFLQIRPAVEYWKHNVGQ